MRIGDGGWSFVEVTASWCSSFTTFGIWDFGVVVPAHNWRRLAFFCWYFYFVSFYHRHWAPFPAKVVERWVEPLRQPNENDTMNVVHRRRAIRRAHLIRIGWMFFAGDTERPPKWCLEEKKEVQLLLLFPINTHTMRVYFSIKSSASNFVETFFEYGLIIFGTGEFK